MGVPVLTLEGDSVVSRQTYSVLANLNLCADLACSTVTAYVARAVALANDRPTLARLRSGLRQRMQASPICQAAAFTHDFEALLRSMWTAWCNDTKIGSNVASAPVKSALVAIKNIAVDSCSKSD
jgi:predicted O-linked N-acetylglucosamine transferase (SPINDLY family)